MIRSIFSIVTGYILFGLAVWILWTLFGYSHQHLPPDNFYFLSIFCECLFATGIGYLTAFIAKRKEIVHATILFGIYIMLALISIVFKMFEGPFWTQLTSFFPIAPCILLGGYIRQRQLKTQPI